MYQPTMNEVAKAIRYGVQHTSATPQEAKKTLEAIANHIDEATDGLGIDLINGHATGEHIEADQLIADFLAALTASVKVAVPVAMPVQNGGASQAGCVA